MTKQTYRNNNRSNNAQQHSQRDAGHDSRDGGGRIAPGAKIEETATDKRRPTLIAYQVKNTGEDQAYWTAIGAAWLNKDNFSFSLQLDAIPTDGRIHDSMDGGGRIASGTAIELYPPKEQG